MPAIPDSTKTSLAQRLRQHARDHWPQLSGLHVRYHSQFAYVEGELADGDRLPLIRLRYGGSASFWGFGLYLASDGKYHNQILPSGLPSGTPQEALDCACDLYLQHQPPKDFRA
ncbi:hypothetical protein ACIHAX_36220 [Nocardia sp. NPDC051929]|uniref:hypothetical protein n=1 Tax=Nocardia sp. NPDC051929 TaxID=3364327 RepID=UPI0037C626D1